MNADTLIQNLETITEAPGGMSSFRALVFNLAVSGRLVEQIDFPPSAVDSVPENLKKIFSHADLVDWLLLPLTECVEIYNGNSTSATEKNRLTKVVDGRPLVATKDVGYGFQPISLDTGLKVPLVDTQYKIAPANAVLICLEGGSAGKKMGLLSQEVCFGNKLFANICKPWIDSKYLLICLLSSNFSSQFQMQLSGIIGGISKAKYGQIKIPLPPLSEQKRIVAKVDELMALCDQLEQQQKQRDNLRTATRKSAIDAISTATTPEELEAAWKRINNNWDVIADTPESVGSLKELILSKYLLGKSSRKGAWKISKFGDLGTCRLGKMLDKAKNVGTPHGYLRNANVQWFRIDLSDISQMKVRADDVAEYSLQPGDLLICEGGEPGRCAIVGREIKGLLFQKALHRFRPNSETNSKFVAYWLMLASKNGTLASRFTGVTISHLTGQVLKNLDIAVPDIAEQNEVVESIDRLMALCDQLEARLKVRSEVAEKFARSVVNAA